MCSWRPHLPAAPDNYLLQLAQILMQVWLKVLQIDDGVDDQLPRSMVGDLTSSFCSVEWYGGFGNIE